MKTFLKITIIIILTLYSLLFTPYSALAENMNSDNYRLQMGNFNMTGGGKSSPGYKMMDTVGQTAPGEYSKNGYIIKAGFSYIKTIIPFAFSISDLTVDFGPLVPGTPSTQEIILTVSAGGAGGYQVRALENHPLKIIGGTTTIPDTICNGSTETCDYITAKLWDNDNKYGFGFNISGMDVPTDFSDTDHYRQFSDQTLNEASQIIMNSDVVGKNRTATVKFKVNIDSIQAAGNYDNLISFIATPGY